MAGDFWTFQKLFWRPKVDSQNCPAGPAVKLGDDGELNC